MENPNHELIIRYLEGTADSDEKRRFLAWAQADPANKELYFKLKTIYDTARQGQAPLDIDASWNRLLAKRRRQRPATMSWRRAASYAAAVAVAALAGWQITRLTAPAAEPATMAARYVSGDGIETNKVILSDGTTVHLGAQTTFYCADGFGPHDRNVYLEGEALFEVMRDAASPFTVHNGDRRVEVLGTTFNVSAFAVDSLFVTTLLEGSVKVDIPGHETTYLSPDQQLTYNRNTGETTLADVDAGKIVDWTRGYYYFEAQTLSSILHRLGNVYGVDFDLSLSRKDASITYTGTFYRGQNIREILDVINLSIPIRYTIADTHVSVSSR